MTEKVYDLDAIKRKIRRLERARSAAEDQMFSSETISEMGVHARRRTALNDTINHMRNFVGAREC